MNEDQPPPGKLLQEHRAFSNPTCMTNTKFTSEEEAIPEKTSQTNVFSFIKSLLTKNEKSSAESSPREKHNQKRTISKIIKVEKMGEAESVKHLFEKFGRIEYIENVLQKDDIVVKYNMIDDSKKAYKWLSSQYSDVMYVPQKIASSRR